MAIEDQHGIHTKACHLVVIEEVFYLHVLDDVVPVLPLTTSFEIKHKFKETWQKHGDWGGLGGHEGNTPKEKGAKITKYQRPIEAIYSA